MRFLKPFAIAALFGAVSIANASFAETVTTQTTTSSSGTLSEMTPGTIVIKSETAPEPVPYTYTKTTTYVDEDGNPVAIDTVKSGVPMTVYYTEEGGSRVASKVVVKRTMTRDSTGTTRTEEKTITTP